MRAVPLAHRHNVGMDRAVWDALLDGWLDFAEPGGEESGRKTAAQMAVCARFWYACAAKDNAEWCVTINEIERWEE